MIELTLNNLENFTRGAAFLGTGGGGDPYIGKLMLKHQLEKGKIIKTTKNREARYYLPIEAVLSVSKGTKISAGTIIARIPR